MDKKYTLIIVRLIMALLFVSLAVSCSLPGRIRNLPSELPIPDGLKPKPTGTHTLEAGAPDVTQIVVKYTPTNAPTLQTTVAPTQGSPAPTEASAAPTTQPAAYTSQPDLLIFQDALLDGWQNWSWDTQVSFESTDPVFQGTKAISAQINKGWAAVYLHTDNPVSTTRYTAVRFWIHGGSKGGQNIAFKVIDAYNKNWESLVALTPTAAAWTEVTVPLERLNNPEEIGALVWQDNSGNADPAFSIDGVTLVARTGSPPTPLPPIAGPDLTVDALANQKPISPYIYGMNFASVELATELHLPVRRWGGNATSLYNFKLDVHNTGSDWYFENIPEYNSNPAALPDGSSVDHTIDQDRQTGTKTILSLPLIGWTPKRRVQDHPYDCSYKVSRYGAQESVDAWDADCGNGKTKSGKNLTGNDPNDAYMPVTPEFIQEWITHLTGKYGKATDGGVMFYNLGNEPMLWPYTHRDVHPEMTTYDEIRDRTFQFAPVLKQIDPSAQTLGPVAWGWCGYLYSAKDECKPGPDYSAHGNTYFVEWYLQQMAAYEKEHGLRLLDYLDLHIYPQAQGISSDNPGDAAAQELRLRSTRALWDPTYVDESWIAKPIFLIPQMREWVNKNYPGTKLALTEYSWGGKGSLNGALAQADILGIFGREGLDLATLWNPPDIKQPASYAFRMFLNYDGKGSAFGDTSVSATSADQEKLAIYAAQRQKDGALTVIILNKTRKSLISKVDLKNISASASSAQVYRYSADNLNQIETLPNQALTAGGFSTTFPPQSITLLIIP
jgi:hypothetical protein